MSQINRSKNHMSLDDVLTTSQDSWRIFRIMAEFAESLETLKKVGPAVSMFGSARTPVGSPYYELAQETARQLSEAGFAVITGGGPGIMEAGNRGAKEGGSASVGLNIKLPHEQHTNPYQTVSFDFNHFFTRKYMFVRFAAAYVVMPGGFGTLDEVMESLTLMQTGIAPKMPLIMMGSDFWSGLIQWFRDSLVKEKMIDPQDMDLVQVIDNPELVVETIFKFYESRSLTMRASDYDKIYSL